MKRTMSEIKPKRHVITILSIALVVLLMTAMFTFLNKGNMSLENRVLKVAMTSLKTLPSEAEAFVSKADNDWHKLVLRPLNKVGFDNEVLYLAFEHIQEAQVVYSIQNEQTGVYEYRHQFLPTDYVYPYFSIPKEMNAEATLYLSYNAPSVRIKAFHSSFEDFVRKRNRDNAIVLLNLGVILAMALLNFILFISTRRLIYFLHSVFVISIWMMLYYFSGVGYLINGKIESDLILIWQSIATFSATAFIFKFLEIYKFKSLRILFLFLFAITFTSVVWTMIFSFESSIAINRLTLFATYFVIFCTSWIMRCKFKSVSIFYFIAIILLILGGLASVVSQVTNSFGTDTKLYLFFGTSIETFLFTAGIFDQIRKVEGENEMLVIRASTDALTGLYNRRWFDNHLIERIGVERDSSNWWLLIVDIDYFKRVNDTYGHNVGDEVLIKVSELLKTNVRRTDFTIRWGGEEFVIVLQDIQQGDVISIAEKLRVAVERLEYGTLPKVTISIGIAKKSINMTFEEWFKAADGALYQAKNNGRNRLWLKNNSTGHDDFEWHKAYECGVKVIDDHHKKLIRDINTLMNQSNYENESFIMEALNNLSKSVILHFDKEEKVLIESGYYAIEEHSKTHGSLVESIMQNIESYKNKEITIQELSKHLYAQVIIGHMISEDIKYHKHLFANTEEV